MIIAVVQVIQRDNWCFESLFFVAWRLCGDARCSFEYVFCASDNKRGAKTSFFRVCPRPDPSQRSKFRSERRRALRRCADRWIEQTAPLVFDLEGSRLTFGAGTLCLQTQTPCGDTEMAAFLRVRAVQSQRWVAFRDCSEICSKMDDIMCFDGLLTSAQFLWLGRF